MLPDRAPDLIIFDLDETLLDHRPVLREAFSQVFKNMPETIREDGQKHLDQSLSRFHNAVIVWDDFCKNLAEPLYSKSLGELNEAYGRVSQLPLYEGAAEFLRTMKSRGVSLYLVTRATPEFAQKSLDANGIASLFSQIYSRSEETKTALYKKIFNHFAASGPVGWIIGDSCDDLQCAVDLGNPNIDPIAFSDKSAAYLLPPRLPYGAKRYYIRSYGEALKQLKI